MSGRKPRGGPRPLRRLDLWVECLDSRELLSIGFGHPVGPYLAPATVRPRVPGPAPAVVPNLALNSVLTSLLQINTQTNVSSTQSLDGSAQSDLGKKIVKQPFINSVLSNYDTYQLLQSQAMSGLVGSQAVGSTSQTTDTVTYIVQRSNILIGTDTSLVTVPPSNGAAGFIAQVPTANIRLLSDQIASVAIPVSEIPADAPVPTVNTVPTGTLGDVYASTGPLFEEALSTGSGQPRPDRAADGPRAPTDPGVQSQPQLLPCRGGQVPPHVPRGGEQGPLHPGGRSAVPGEHGRRPVHHRRQEPESIGHVPAGGPAVGTAPGEGTAGRDARGLVRRFRRLANVASPLSGLQLPGVGNFPGRIDVGFVFARNGDYGLVLTARGPLLSDPANLNSEDLVGGDVRITSSNAPSLAALNGQSTVEGVTLGTVRSGALASTTNANGVHTSSASVGYGSGFEIRDRGRLHPGDPPGQRVRPDPPAPKS